VRGSAGGSGVILKFHLVTPWNQVSI
jgi:hypothetical protein